MIRSLIGCMSGGCDRGGFENVGFLEYCGRGLEANIRVYKEGSNDTALVKVYIRPQHRVTHELVAC